MFNWIAYVLIASFMAWGVWFEALQMDLFDTGSVGQYFGSLRNHRAAEETVAPAAQYKNDQYHISFAVPEGFFLNTFDNDCSDRVCQIFALTTRSYEDKTSLFMGRGGEFVGPEFIVRGYVYSNPNKLSVKQFINGKKGLNWSVRKPVVVLEEDANGSGVVRVKSNFNDICATTESDGNTGSYFFPLRDGSILMLNGFTPSLSATEVIPPTTESCDFYIKQFDTLLHSISR